MGIDFILVGVYFIWLIFYKERVKQNLPLFLGVGLLLVGYFIKSVKFNCISINICRVLGIINLIVFILISGRVNVKKSLTSSIVIAILYGFINFIDIDFNLFFGTAVTVLIVIVINTLNMLTIDEYVLSTFGGLILVEIFNALFMYSKLDYVAIFSDDLAMCIVVCIGIRLFVNWILKLFKVVKYEKVD